MITVGNGHKAPAEAIRAGLERLYPNCFKIDVLDFTAEVGDVTLDRQVKDSWNLLLEYPHIAYWGQIFIDTVIPVQVTRFVQGRVLRKHARNAADYIKKNNYNLIVATHYFTIQAIARAKRKYGITTPLIGLNTDPFDANAMWAEPSVDEMLVASQIAKERLIQKQVPPEKISIFGYPLGLQFLEQQPKRDQARKELGLDSSMLTILQSAGGEGIGGQLEHFVRAVLHADLPVQYIIACGRNNKLLQHLTHLVNKHSNTQAKIIPKGFITNMQTWLAASDLVLGKAGASTTLEALAMNRPIFHTSYAAYNEKTNIDWCIEQGVGRYLPKPEQLLEILREYLEQPAALQALQKKVETLHPLAGTLEIAEHLVRRYKLL